MYLVLNILLMIMLFSNHLLIKKKAFKLILLNLGITGIIILITLLIEEKSYLNPFFEYLYVFIILFLIDNFIIYPSIFGNLIFLKQYDKIELPNKINKLKNNLYKLLNILFLILLIYITIFYIINTVKLYL